MLKAHPRVGLLEVVAHIYGSSSVTSGGIFRCMLTGRQKSRQSGSLEQNCLVKTDPRQAVVHPADDVRSLQIHPSSSPHFSPRHLPQIGRQGTLSVRGLRRCWP